MDSNNDVVVSFQGESTPQKGEINFIFYHD